MIRSKGLFALPYCLVAVLPFSAPAEAAGDYPTNAVVDYVLGCMRSNGQTRDMLDRCSCSIDVIASIVPYEHYETAETFRRMAQMNGEASGLFRQSLPAKAAGAELRRAQAEADIRCF
ncbi:hypothetical protein SAZ10_32225 [Mesorhizobium sp. BAC0120]|uniref:hypothetical protein n=1 Tax=Mesorhizobium sp. BAC0120 TaxID=3090670 RepID=UPI00298C7DDA|nr:hypothetical protein [Mesorhizobium sp. BAC0120]MDW6026437.1 hypothetical protein [Mesorhizobium sp. BAC0120]